MNLKKLCSGLAASAVLSSILLTGCASEKTITTENAPNDIMKNLAAISSDSSAEDVTGALSAVVMKTAENYNYQLGLKAKGEGTTLDLGDGSIKTRPIETSSVDYRAALSDSVYEFLDQEIEERKSTGLMKADADEIITAYADTKSGSPDQKSMELSYISSETSAQQLKYSADQIEDVAKNTVMIPLFADLGANLIISPVSLPEYYDYSLVQKGNNYTFTLKIKDLDKYNEYIDQYYSDKDQPARTDLNGDGSLMADEYVTDRMEISMTMNEEGVISSLTNSNYSKVSSGENQTDDVYLAQTISVIPCPQSLTDSMIDFFDQLSKGDMKEGQTFTLSFDGTVRSGGDDSKKDEDKSEQSEDKKEEQAEQQKQESSSSEEKKDSSGK